MDRQLKKQCNDSIQYIKFESISGSGAKVYAAAASIKCFIAGYQTVYLGMDGEEYTSEYTIFVDETCPVMGLRDMIIVSNDKRMPVRHFKLFKGERGQIEGALVLI